MIKINNKNLINYSFSCSFSSPFSDSGSRVIGFSHKQGRVGPTRVITLSDAGPVFEKSEKFASGSESESDSHAGERGVVAIRITYVITNTKQGIKQYSDHLCCGPTLTLLRVKFLCVT